MNTMHIASTMTAFCIPINLFTYYQETVCTVNGEAAKILSAALRR